MGKRKKLSEVEITQYTQPSSNKRHVGTVHYVQNESGSGALHQQHQQQQQHQAISQVATSQGTTYYQIQQTTAKVAPAATVQQVTTTTATTASQAAAPSEENSADMMTYKCIKCQQVFQSKSSFLDHCNQYHYFACDLCTNCLFNDLVQLNVHMIKHINKFDMCEKCHLLCNSAEELKVHLGNHITTYNRDDVIFTSQESAAVLTNEPTSNGSVPLSSVLNDDSLIEQLASELDQSIGKTAKIKPQKYRCGVCKQDFSDPRLLFKHMNQVHINFPLQQQVQAEPPPPPSPPPQVVQQAPQTITTTTENVVYTNLSPDNIYYDERTGQYYTIALMDHSPPLSESAGSQSVIGYLQDSQTPNPTIEYVEEHQPAETIVVEDESQGSKMIHAVPATTVQHQIIQSAPSTRNSNQHTQQPQATTADDHPPQQLVHITRETDLEELIPTTTLVAAESEAAAAGGTTQKVANTKDGGRLQANQKCVSCGVFFMKKFPKQMYCHACVARNTTAALGKH